MMQKMKKCVYIALVQHLNPIIRGILSDDINNGFKFQVSGFRFSFADIALFDFVNVASLRKNK